MHYIMVPMYASCEGQKASLSKELKKRLGVPCFGMGTSKEDSTTRGLKWPPSSDECPASITKIA